MVVANLINFLGIFLEGLREITENLGVRAWI